ncbi:MAG: hypothetical protein U0446_09445 [Dehalococcoidia bacterium]
MARVATRVGSTPTRTSGRNDIQRARRRVVPFLFAAIAALLLGLWAGLLRIGWDLPAGDGDLTLRHGGLMVVGFVGTVIAVERAVALGSPPAFVAPAASAAAGVALIAGAPASVAAGLATLAAVTYSLTIAVLLARHRLPPLAVMLAGGVCLVVAAALWWDGESMRRVVLWWMSFLVLTVGAERLEIIRFQRFTRPDALAGLAVLLFLLLGPAVAEGDIEVGTKLLGLALALGPLWLVRRDIALRTARTDGLARFAAIGVLTASAWLVVAGVLLATQGVQGGLEYDAVVHAFFIGFVFGAIIAHAPIVAPSVTGLRFAYTPLLYLPLAALDGALLVRIAADFEEWADVRRWAGMTQALAIVLFLVLTVASVLRGRTHEAA